MQPTSSNLYVRENPELIDDPELAGHYLAAGKLVAFPTETVYGLGVDATNAHAVDRLFTIKGRPSNNPLIVHIAHLDQLTQVASHIPEDARALLEQFSPGPLTVVVPKQTTIVDSVTAGLSTVGVRIPAHPTALAMLQAAKRPIAAPSANRSRRPSCTTYESVLEDFSNAPTIDAILKGEASLIGMESTVVDCTRNTPRVLRPGAITWEQLRDVIPSIERAGQTVEPGENSPGRLHPHYQPNAIVQIVDSPESVSAEPDCAWLGLVSCSQPNRMGMHCAYSSIESFASNFYEALREADRRQLRVVYCQRVLDTGIGEALADRMRRAAEPK